MSTPSSGSTNVTCAPVASGSEATRHPADSPTAQVCVTVMKSHSTSPVAAWNAPGAVSFSLNGLIQPSLNQTVLTRPAIQSSASLTSGSSIPPVWSAIQAPIALPAAASAAGTS